MRINPKSKSVTYPMEKLEWVEIALGEIEREALENDGVTGDAARSIVSELNSIRDSLCLNLGIQRHEKFAPELQKQAQ